MEYQEKNKNVLQKAINELPQLEPDTDLWSAIEEKLNQSKPIKGIIKLNRWYWSASIAATISLILVYIWIYKIHSTGNENVQLVYSTEENIQNEVNENKSENPFNLALQRIKEYCSTQPELCRDTVFIAMNDQLTQLDQQIYQTQNIIKEHPDQPELLKFRYKLDKEKNKTIKQMIHLINS